MQQATNTTKNSPEVKNYKLWVMKATTAAKEAEKKQINKEAYPQYIAADNIAKVIFAQLQKTATA